MMMMMMMIMMMMMKKVIIEITAEVTKTSATCSTWIALRSSLWHVKRCNIVCGNICVVYRNIYGLKHIFVD